MTDNAAHQAQGKASTPKRSYTRALESLDMSTTSGKTDRNNAINTTCLTVIDRIAYNGLRVNGWYTVAGALIDEATGMATGIAARKTFLALERDGYCDLEFTVPASFAGQHLIAFEYLSEAETDEVGMPLQDSDVDNRFVLDEGEFGDEGLVMGIPIIGSRIDVSAELAMIHAEQAQPLQSFAARMWDLFSEKPKNK